MLVCRADSRSLIITVRVHLTVFGHVVVEIKEVDSRAAEDAKVPGVGEWMWKGRFHEV